ncbi:MAG: hypothetical protein MRY83_13125, partial [Flavobacteriales bacterium]|nr:hypothetical protein [Flavobacteriales bacterium]
MQEYKGTKTITASSKEEWRKWLEKNHESKDSIWLIIYKKNSGKLSVYYDEAVNEALCFGWIDSKINKKDEVSYYQYFSKRNPKSNWSKVNKTKITQLLSQGKMHKSGLKIIEQAKKSGTWSALDDVENLILPKDLKECFNKNKIAY